MKECKVLQKMVDSIWNISYDDTRYLKYNLQFFAQESSGGEKTEAATSKKLQDARKEGQVAKSQELVMAASLFALFIVLKLYIGKIGSQFMGSFTKMYGMISDVSKEEFNVVVAQNMFQDALFSIILISLPVFLSAFIVSFITNSAQMKWEVSTKPMMPKLSKMDPIKGFKKMLSKDKIVELIKSLLKIAVIAYVVYDTMKDKWSVILEFYDVSLNQAIALIGNIVISLGLKISALFMLIGIADLFYQRLKFSNEMKMTKQEVKDEYKQSEGDPNIKGKIKAKMRESSMRRMMQELPQADVIITNPTHFAVAIKYDKETSLAPIIVAKGADHLAAKIKEIAKEHNIEIVENKPLARMLYFNVEIGSEIPQELFQTVAEVLAYVYGLKNKLG